MDITEFTRYEHYKDATIDFEGHHHTGFEMNIVLDGIMEITCGKFTQLLTPGKAAIWWAGEFHSNKKPEGGVEYIMMNFDSESQLFFEGAVFTLTESDMKLVSLLDEELMENSTTHRGEITPSSVYLLESLLTRFEHGHSAKRSINSSSARIFDWANYMMEVFIHENLMVNDIAKSCSVCPTLLKRAFAEHAGKGVKEYFIEMKIEHAKKLLAEGERINMVSENLGFSSPTYFAQVFRRLTGKTPRDYANEKHRV